MILRLPHTKPAHITVPTSPNMVRPLLHHLSALKPSRHKFNLELILSALSQQVRDIHTMRDEHVVALAHNLAVHADRRKSVQAIQDEIMPQSRCFFGHWGGEFGAVDPGFLAYPLDQGFVLADKWIRNQVMLEQVEKDFGGQLASRAPFLEIVRRRRRRG